MRYDRAQLEKDLRSLTWSLAAPANNKWHWEEHKGLANEDVTFKSNVEKKRWTFDTSFFDQLLQYCWRLYNLTSEHDQGDQVMGRVDDTEAFSPSTGHVQWAKVNKGSWERIATTPKTNFAEGAQGNTLKMDKWHAVMNDCWLLGGVHRRANFRLISILKPGNIWNFADTCRFVTVTARELMGLKHFGYTRRDSQDPSNRDASHDITFIPPEDSAITDNATLLSYEKMLKETRHNGPNHGKGSRKHMELTIREWVDPEYCKLMTDIRSHHGT